MNGLLPLPVIDALQLDDRRRAALRPGESFADRDGCVPRLPRFFYEVASWETARNTRLAEHFTLHEFLNVDVRETPALREFPRYVPLAVTLIAAHLELLRQAVGTLVHIAANGGYRSPAHRLTEHASPHCWGTAANIYRIGDQYLDAQENIERFAQIAARVAPAIWVRPYGHEKGLADDHLHLDIGYARLVPRDYYDEASA
ncbi:MAG: hypothetical protein ACRELV_04250 [Longimicrobiales bacterium]